MSPEELDAIEARLEAAGDPPTTFATIVERDVPALLAEVRRLRSALAHYATEANYHEQSVSLYSDVVLEPWIWVDQGETARAALATTAPGHGPDRREMT